MAKYGIMKLGVRFFVLRVLYVLTVGLLTPSTSAVAQDKAVAEVFVGVGHEQMGAGPIFITDNQQFAISKRASDFRLWNYGNGKLIKSFTLKETFDGIAVTPDGRYLIGYEKNYETGNDETFFNEKDTFVLTIFDILSEKIVASELTHETIPYVFNFDVSQFISRNGDVLTRAANGKVYVHEIASGEIVHTGNISGLVRDFSYSKDDTKAFLYTEKDEGPFKIFQLDKQTGDIQSVYDEKVSDANRIAFSGDGARALSVMNRRKIELWDLETGAEINSYKIGQSHLKKRRAEVKDIWLSDDGGLAVIEYFDHKARYGNTQYEYAIMNNLNGYMHELFGYGRGRQIRISPDNEYVFIEAALKHEMFFVSSEKSKEIGFLNSATEFQFCKGEGAVLTHPTAPFHGSFKGLIKAKLSNEKVSAYFGEQLLTFGSLIRLPDGGRMLAGNQLWDIQSGKHLGQVIDENIKLEAFSPDGKSAIVSNPDHVNKGQFDFGNWKVKELDLTTLRFTKTFEVPQRDAKGFLLSYKYSPDGKYLLASTVKMDYRPNAANGKPFVQVWETDTGFPKQRINPGNGGSIEGFDLAKDQSMLLVATFGQYWEGSKIFNEGELGLFDIQTGNKVRTIANETDQVKSTYASPIFLPGNRRAVAGGRVWDINTGSLVRKLNIPVGSRSVIEAVSHDGNKLLRRYVVLADNGKYKVAKDIIDVNTGEVITKNAGKAQVDKLFHDTSFSTYFETGALGEMIAFESSTGEKRATFYHFADGEWVTITADGYYTASSGGGDHLSVRMGLEVFPIDNFFETYYRPDIVQAALSDGNISRLAEANIQSMELPPSVRFTSPENGTTANKKSVTLTAEITDQGGGIDEVRLFHNGKLIEGGTRGLKLASSGKTITREFKVSLLPGTNEFELTALSTGQRIESNPAKLNIKYKGTVATSDLYVLAVGLNEYKNNSMNLNYGRPDAEAFVNSIKTRSDGIFKTVNVKTLYDGQATRSGVKNAFEDMISKAKPQDAFLFFYAGHGVMSEPEGQQQGDFYMALHEATQLYGNNDGLAAHGISAAEMTDLTRRIAARKQMIVLDACQSGGAVETFAMRGAAEQKAIIQLARSAGLVVMASTGTQQYATEFDALGHGVFTYALLNGLQGQADGGSKDGKITVKELEAFINDRVPALTQKHRGQSQYPNSYARGQDFPIGVIK